MHNYIGSWVAENSCGTTAFSLMPSTQTTENKMGSLKCDIFKIWEYFTKWGLENGKFSGMGVQGL